ncbi:branched-chain amino acid aminotransferase [Ruminococcaceae bacterium OttesenSCG-928-D13]|nr:branched-chain amino acid aminotransferase [Ruminococcaceae bacterium OttesenSCG-928-D13]
MDIRITRTTTPKAKPDQNNLGFGRYYTDHMLVMPYDEGTGWHSAEIRPYAPFSLDPASMVFHYAQECFEGMKAYRTTAGRVQLFRPEENAKRMARTHNRLCIPEVPVADFVEAVRALVSVEQGWVPSVPDASLYIRPTTIATEPHLGVKPSTSYLFYVILSPSGPYYATGLDPVKIFVEDELTRAAPGGTGAIKCGGNYAASLAGQVKAHQLGYSQVLWLDGAERRYVEEVGAMNVFFVIDGQVYTAPTAPGTVLPGITRMSCIDLLRDWGYTVREDRLAIDDLMAAGRAGRLTEVFGTGTAAVISPVGELRYKEEPLLLGGGQTGPITRRLYDTLTGIQWGRLPDEKGWIVPVD